VAQEWHGSCPSDKERAPVLIVRTGALPFRAGGRLLGDGTLHQSQRQSRPVLQEPRPAGVGRIPQGRLRRRSLVDDETSVGEREPGAGKPNQRLTVNLQGGGETEGHLPRVFHQSREDEGAPSSVLIGIVQAGADVCWHLHARPWSAEPR